MNAELLIVAWLAAGLLGFVLTTLWAYWTIRAAVTGALRAQERRQAGVRS